MSLVEGRKEGWTELRTGLCAICPVHPSLPSFIFIIHPPACIHSSIHSSIFPSMHPFISSSIDNSLTCPFVFHPSIPYYVTRQGRTWQLQDARTSTGTSKTGARAARRLGFILFKPRLPRSSSRPGAQSPRAHNNILWYASIYMWVREYIIRCIYTRVCVVRSFSMENA